MSTGESPENPKLESSGDRQDVASIRTNDTTESNYLQGFKLISVFIGLFLAVLCVVLDRSIIATAIPKITTEFNSLPDVAWYGSAYLLTSACFQLMYGKLYAEIGLKWVFLAAVIIFEVGSVICAAAPSSNALIIGRAIAGMGSAGVSTGALTIISVCVPLRDRPKYTGATGAAIGIAQAVGPTIGGSLADYVTWRWCFWINLPVGAVTIGSIVLFLNMPPRPKPENPPTLFHVLQKMDFLGTVFLMPAVVSLLLGLQWGGINYPWSNWRIILLFCIFGVCTVLWVAIQVHEGDKATVPLRIVRQRSVASAMFYMFNMMGMMFIFIYYIPIWFQAVLDYSAYQSGINLLANTIPMAVTAVAAGFITSKVGYYVPMMIIGTVFSAVAGGLIFRYYTDTSTGYWIASLVILGIGIGAGTQQTLMVPQTVLRGGDVALGTAAMIFMQTISGTIFIAIGQTVFQSRLVSEIAARVPHVDIEVVIASGASELKQAMSKFYSPTEVQEILTAYAEALQRVFLIALVLGCLSAFGSATVEWRSVKKEKAKTDKKAAVVDEKTKVRMSSEIGAAA